MNNDRQTFSLVSAFAPHGSAERQPYRKSALPTDVDWTMQETSSMLSVDALQRIYVAQSEKPSHL